MKLGFIGTGTIAAAIVKGLQASPAKCPVFLSPRNVEIARRLAERYANAQIAATNQAVLDASDTVILAVRPQIAHEVLTSLRFRPDHHVVSLIAAVSLKYLQSVTAPASIVTRAVPLPAVAYRQAPTAMYPPNPTIKALFDELGIVIELESEAEFDAFTTATSIMSTYFGFADTTASWMEHQGVAPQKAHAFVGQMLRGLAAATTVAPDRTFAQMVEDHQTPGGLNEQVFRALLPDGRLVELDRALDGVLARLIAGKLKG
ncbi:pyrroline-5-carboxylate reductase [Terriglobus saanensis]|uniref:NADP oxidoreductase coenzyme F420-dependent n=1 Tax=Terriglobus saanensis (strain ATCC BAA-1853 / DSM 23119 / SP1PR4) TaxID=401053 RepID=E8V3H3_TERSS|nr:pyrroline-5-carboxylate reductase [Terriglobus saanensis]ADV83586.1 NADP oxidoreductase coenzyme F420-dependent [Terriglobus saanensis SP1PR4]